MAGKLCLFLVPRGARQALRSHDYPRLGGGRACNIELTDVHLAADALLGDGSDALPAIEGAVDRAMAALGAEAVGIMQTLLDTTLEYTKIRKQFGRPLAANQVIRHRLADMAMQTDEARSMALRAALKARRRADRRAAAPRRPPRPRSANARASSPSSRCSFMAAWASPRNSTSAPISSGSSPSTRCSAAAPITIAAMPRLAAAPSA